MDEPALSYICKTWHVIPMRRPTLAELEFTILLFLVLAPLAYFTIRGLFALFG